MTGVVDLNDAFASSLGSTGEPDDHGGERREANLPVVAHSRRRGPLRPNLGKGRLGATSAGRGDRAYRRRGKTTLHLITAEGRRRR